MIRKKHISILVILSLLLPLIGSLSFDNSISAYEDSTTNEFISLDAITTQTFTGVINITTFVGPDNAHEIVLNSIKNAQTSFHLEVYTLSSQSLVDELISAHGRGVEVIVQLSDDRVNSYEDDYTERAAIQLDAAGIDVYWTSSSFAYTHAKFWIVDGQETYVYSGNWAPSSIPESPEARTNREMGFLFNDVAIASYFEAVFTDDGLISTPYSTITNPGSLQDPETSGTYEHPFDATTFVEYAEVTPIFSPDNSYDLLSNLIQSATSTIDLELQYIKFDCDLLDDVIDAALGGVAVRVLIPEPTASNENVTETLINNGVQVKFFKGLGHNHNKYVSVDGETVQVSSINWSNNSIENNREAGAIVKNTNIAAYFKTVFDYDWANGETPVGYAAPVALVSPDIGGIASGTYNFQAAFALNAYTSGILQIDGSTVHTWTSPTGIVSVNINTNTYSDGIHTIKVIGNPTVGDPIEVQKKINIINEPDWKLLITEIRYDANDEPEGEFVEIYNSFSFNIYLENWKLTDGEGQIILPENAQINSEDILIFAYDNTIYKSEMSALGISSVPDRDYSMGDIQLANSGDNVNLEDPDGTIKDAVAWGSGSVSGVTAWSGASTGQDQTLQRVPADQDTNDCNLDFEIDTPDPGIVYVTVPTTSPTNTGFLSYEFVIPIVGLIGIAIILFRRKR